MTVVIGTAGHIDHGKTTLLRALTGTDTDRLPEEQRRGLTIEIGFAHVAPDDGAELDFVDVPGHDKLVGNMLVGAGEIDAALLAVAADDGPRAQTWEHLGLLDALAIDDGIVVITKADLVARPRLDEVGAEMREALASTSLADIQIMAVSARSGEGIDELRAALAALRDRMTARPNDEAASVWLAVDRAFSIRGRGTVVTGSSRGRAIRGDEILRVVPDDSALRVRGIQVHDMAAECGPGGGRVALNVAGEGVADLRRGSLLVSGNGKHDPLAAVAADRLLVALRRPATIPGRGESVRWPPSDGVAARLHIGTDQADAVLGRRGREDVLLSQVECIAMLRLDRHVAAAVGQRFVLRQSAPAGLLAGGRVLDIAPVRGRSRHRQDPARLQALAGAVDQGERGAITAALLELHGRLRIGAGVELAADVESSAVAAALEAVEAHHQAHPDHVAVPLALIRADTARAISERISISRPEAEGAAASVLESLLGDGRLVRAADGVRSPRFAPPAREPELDAAMSRLEAALDVSAPPSLARCAADVGCSADGIRALDRAGRIVIVDEDLAWSAAAYERLRAEALALARSAPLTPAALRDASGTSRKYVMALLEDLARRGVLVRTPAGHVPGPRA